MPNTLLAALMAACLSLNPAAARAADLMQLYRQALANDAVYASARDALAAGREKTAQGRAGLLPLIQAGGQNTRNTGQQSSSLNASLGLPAGGPDDIITTTASTSHVNSYTVSLSQPLYNWAAWQQYEQGKLAQATAAAVFAQAGDDLIVRVAQAYFDVLTAEDNLDATRAQKVATTAQLVSARRNHEIGTQTITDTHEAQAAYDQVVAQELAAANEVDKRRAELETIIGAAPAALAPLRAGVALAAPAPAALGPWLASAGTQNHAVISAGLGLEMARRQISLSRAGHLPTAALIASTTHNYQTGYGASTNNVVGVAWNMPLFSGYAVTSRVRESIALESRARNDLDAIRRNAALNARQAFLDMNSGLAQVTALEAAETSSQASLRSNQLGYQIGVRVNIDVLNAQKLLYATRKDLARARYDTIMSGLRLKSAAGTLSDADLGPVNALLVH